MKTPFNAVHIVPSYAQGFTFLWTLSAGFSDPLPWTFTVQQAPAPEGPWLNISPGIVNMMAWSDSKRRLINKDLVLYFRVQMITSKENYYSHVKMPYGDLARREFLLVREVMRKEVLQMRTLSGIEGQLWIRATFGPKCTSCIDPITGTVKNTSCPLCYGTGREPGYHGPYNGWMTFSPAKRDEKMAGDGTGTRQPYVFNVRMISCPVVKDQDIIIDPRQDKRYYVDRVDSVTEIRRIAVIQQIVVREAPVSEPIYRLGTSA